MLCARNIFNEIHHNDECFQLFCSIAAKGEIHGGWQNDLVAGLTSDPAIAETIARRSVDRERHGRLFYAQLKRRALDPVRVPLEMDYDARLEAEGIGLSRERLGEGTPLSVEELLRYLVHSHVTEQRARDEIERQQRVLGSDPAWRDAGRLIAGDEARHLADCEGSLRSLASRGHARAIATTRACYARVEARVYRDVSLAVMRHMGGILGWSPPQHWAMALGVHAGYTCERMSHRLPRARASRD